MLGKNDYARLKEMGFSRDEIDKAAKIAAERKVDLLDVLTKFNGASNTSQNQQQNQPQNSKPQRLVNPFVYRPLIKPRSQVVMDEYECIFRENDYTSAGDIDDRREQGIPITLKNVSNCCYLNSLLQMFFLMPKFVDIVLSARPISKEQLDIIVPNGIRNKRIFNSFGLLRSLQSLYSNMILSTKKLLDPSDILRNLVDSLGNKISYGQEKDLSQISLQFISRLQECVIYTEDSTQILPSYWQSPEKDQFNSVVGANSKAVTSPIKELLFGDKVEICNDSDETRIESKFFGILLNPVHDSLYKALDEQFHFKVEHEGKLISKDVWITKQPDYLFFFIQRTNYDKQLGVVKMKNRIKFDFEIYIDRYLFKNKHKEEQQNPILLESVAKRDEINKQINHLQSMMKALQECHVHAAAIKELPVELPKLEPLAQLLGGLKKNLTETEQTIAKLESREEKYKLRFIIVHRGEADSGHYWGYGFTGGCWWRYDIHNSKMEKQQMVKEIEHGDVVVYALIYGRYEQEYSPSYSLFLSDSDLLGTQHNYNRFVSQQLRSKILAENIHREKLNEDRKSAESISVVTLDYEQRFRVVNEAVRRYNDKHSKVPYLGNFSGYLRWFSGQHPNFYFKAHLLDVAIRSSTKYNIREVPSEEYRNQLASSLKQNLSKYSCPQKYSLTKMEHDKLNDRFSEYKNNVAAIAVLQKMFESIGLDLLGDALKCAHYVIQLVPIQLICST